MDLLAVGASVHCFVLNPCTALLTETVVAPYLQENEYPKGPSVQFYKIFLDTDVRSHFECYDAVAIIEWDVTVAHDQSFERLYNAAFDDGEPFWVKGSILAGTNFHGTAAVTDNWRVLGHINGNAIYNNTDTAFVDFIKYTLDRWNYDYSYDVALWATIADFPYSWPLWQRYYKKFVATNLVSFFEESCFDRLVFHMYMKSVAATSTSRIS